MFSRLLSKTRYAIIIPVIGSWLAALLSILFGLYEVVLTAVNLFSGNVDAEKGVKLSVINLVEAVDLFLPGTVFYIIAMGLYELFIDANAPMPDWLKVHDLDDLKGNLIGVIVVILGVQFLAQALNWKGDATLLPYGAAIVVVILALAFFLGQKQKKKGQSDLPDSE